MVRKQRKRISYVLPLAKSSGGHRLGVNGLAVDPYNRLLYSGGRDGVICAWDLNLEVSQYTERGATSALNASGNHSPKGTASTSLRRQVQAHTHWINDIALVQGNEALVSASSDITVKIWRPAAEDPLPPQTIGQHSDYVKKLASPGPFGTFVASGGLDRKVSLWDLSGKGQQLQINVDEGETTAKGSVYALAVTPTLLACGGPDGIVRIWDPRSSRRVTKLVGHTDNIRDVLISQDGDTFLTASSDSTIKLWSLSAGRCMYTLTMHNDSVWSLFSDHPRLSVFYSADRSGLVAKNDTRNCAEVDEGLSVAVCQEHTGIFKVVCAGDYMWTATSSSSINRWKDVDTQVEVQYPEFTPVHRASIATTGRTRVASPQPMHSPQASRDDGNPNKIPFKSVLTMSHASTYVHFRNRDPDAATIYSSTTQRKPSVAIAPGIEPMEQFVMAPFRSMPDDTIEGQHGLIKHIMLNDRRRVLTVDTAGEVQMWDLIKCMPVQSFGKRHLDDVLKEVNTQETVAHWCAVDTRTGSLTCVLEENNCFDAEMYADELNIEEKIEFREDQRINLGKWILRYLFSNLIDEEIKWDEAFRKTLIDTKRHSMNPNVPPSSIQLPANNATSWLDTASGPATGATIRPPNGWHVAMPTPGLSIGLATPAAPPPLPSVTSRVPLPGAADDGEDHGQAPPPNADRRSMDYFSHAPVTGPAPNATTQPQAASDSTVSNMPEVPASPTLEKDSGEKAEKGLFGGKKFRMNFGMKSLKKNQEKEVVAKPAESQAEDAESRSSKTEERIIEDNFGGAIQKIRIGYETQLQQLSQTEKDPHNLKLESAITPSLPVDTPVLKPPAQTMILIQEDSIDSGGVADLFEGTVASLGAQLATIEKVAPTWLAEVLLKNTIPLKEPVKISFTLEPYWDHLPIIASDGESNTRLNANRMLRARKILAYVAERIEAPPAEQPEVHAGVEVEALRPEEYLELVCQDQVIPPTMTLATIRTHVFRGGGDVVLHYRTNGRKSLVHRARKEGPVRDANEGARDFTAMAETSVVAAGNGNGNGNGNGGEDDQGRPSQGSR